MVWSIIALPYDLDWEQEQFSSNFWNCFNYLLNYSVMIKKVSKANLSNRNPMKQFNYKKRTLWNGAHLAGISSISIALIIWVISNLIENKEDTDPFTLYMIIGIFLLLGIFSLSTYSGTLIDFGSNTYKEYQSIFWYKKGKWTNLPKIEHAELILHSFRSSNPPNGVSPTLSGEVTIYKVVLIANGTKFLALDYARESDAVKGLEEIKEGFCI